MRLINSFRLQQKNVTVAGWKFLQLLEPLTGKVWTLEDFEAYPALLVMFICNHCPFVIHLKRDIVNLANDYYRDDPDFMAEEAKIFDYPFPYLYDEVNPKFPDSDLALTRLG
ncbi:hypothetical protein SUGI_0894330 [Cryptomeria japonica]|nr:hypothetical protein SUGI_0894330 [Cryptomeria japonica]